MAKNLTTDEYLKRVIDRHGERYNYTLVDYKNSHDKIKIVCEKHGVFEQTPNAHMNGQGCPKCGIDKISEERRKGKEEFVRQSVLIHNNKFGYSKVEYVNCHKKVTITCPEHGDFEVAPKSHLLGYDCKKCASRYNAVRQRSNTESFIAKAKVLHSEKYTYERSVYTQNSNKITITCPAHGDFEQDAAAHLAGKGCNRCASVVRANVHRKDTEYFVNKSKNVHGDKYDYSLSEYTTAKTMVEILCHKHGSFWQAPDKHIQGRGCPACANRGFDTSSAGYLYVLKNNDITKVGITNRKPTTRAAEVSSSYGSNFEVVSEYFFPVGRAALNIETSLLNVLEDKYKQPIEKFDGSTECFIDVDLLSLTEEILSHIERFNNDY